MHPLNGDGLVGQLLESLFDRRRVFASSGTAAAVADSRASTLSTGKVVCAVPEALGQGGVHGRDRFTEPVGLA